MSKIILCRGIQGSGKTTWAKQWVLEDPEHRVRFNNDDIRNMLGKYWVTSREVLVRALRDTCVHRAMDESYDIVIDNMNLSNNENPTQKDWTSSPKPYAHIYIDDAALGVPLKHDSLSERPYVDWNMVKYYLHVKNVL